MHICAQRLQDYGPRQTNFARKQINTAFMKTNINTNQFSKLYIIPLVFVVFAGGAFAYAKPGAQPVKRTAPINLRTADSFVILSQSGITNVPTSAITGDIGSSPITGAANLLTCTEVTGTVYSVDTAGPSPCTMTAPTILTTAVGDMQAAYTDAAGRAASVTELGAGNIGGMSLTPGVYKWSSNVTIPKNLTLSGGAKDVWIFEVAGDLDLASATKVVLRGGAQAKNIFWQVAGQATLGTSSHFEGTILSKTLIAMKTGASINGRLLAQTAVTLQMNTVKLP